MIVMPKGMTVLRRPGIDARRRRSKTMNLVDGVTKGMGSGYEYAATVVNFFIMSITIMHQTNDRIK